LQEAFEVANRGLDTIGESSKSTKCKLLAARGYAVSFMPGTDYEDAHNPLLQATDLADELNDEGLLGLVFYRKTLHHRNYWQGDETVKFGLQGAELLRSKGNLYEAAIALASAQCGLIWKNRLDEAAKVAAEANAMATKAGNQVACWLIELHDMCRDIAVSGNLESFERRVTDHLEISRATDFAWIPFDYALLARAQFWSGRWGESKESFMKAADLEIPGVFFGLGIGPRLMFNAYAGDKEAALDTFKQIEILLPHSGCKRTFGAWIILESAVEGLAMLGERERLSGLYPLTLEAIATGNQLRILATGVVETTAGIAAAAAEKWDKAEEHFHDA